MENSPKSSTNDFSAEDDAEASEIFENAAQSEFKRLIESLKKKEEERSSVPTDETAKP